MICNVLSSLEEKDIKYIYFNRLNLAQKSTLTHVKETPKYIINLISQLSKELESYAHDLLATPFTKFKLISNMIIYILLLAADRQARYLSRAAATIGSLARSRTCARSTSSSVKRTLI